MPERKNKKQDRTRVYLNSDTIRQAKRHAARNGFSLSGWVRLLVKKALIQKK